MTSISHEAAVEASELANQRVLFEQHVADLRQYRMQTRIENTESYLKILEQLNVYLFDLLSNPGDKKTDA